MSITTPSRRRVLTAAVWSAPAVVVSSAAPAFAASTGTGTLTISRGATRAGTPPDDDGLGAVGLFFNGFTITPSKSSSAALVLRVTHTWGDVYDYYSPNAPAGWTQTAGVNEARKPDEYTWSAGLTAGTPVLFGPSGSEAIYFDDNASRGAFTLTFMAVGFDSAQTVFETRPA